MCRISEAYWPPPSVSSLGPRARHGCSAVMSKQQLCAHLLLIKITILPIVETQYRARASVYYAYVN